MSMLTLLDFLLLGEEKDEDSLFVYWLLYNFSVKNSCAEHLWVSNMNVVMPEMHS